MNYFIEKNAANKDWKKICRQFCKRNILSALRFHKNALHIIKFSKLLKVE